MTEFCNFVMCGWAFSEEEVTELTERLSKKIDVKPLFKDNTGSVGGLDYIKTLQNIYIVGKLIALGKDGTVPYTVISYESLTKDMTDIINKFEFTSLPSVHTGLSRG